MNKFIKSNENMYKVGHKQSVSSYVQLCKNIKVNWPK